MYWQISRELIQSEKERISGFARVLSIQVNRHLSENRSYMAGVTRHVSGTVQQYFEKNKMRLDQNSRLTFLYSRNLLDRQKHEIGYRLRETTRITGAFMQTQREKLERYEKLNRYLDPDQILKRGFSVTLSDGKVLRDTAGLSEGDEITTILYKGRIKSSIKLLAKQK